MIRIAITAAAFEAIVTTLPFGTVSFERDPDANGDRLIWLAPHVLDKLRAIKAQKQVSDGAMGADAVLFGALPTTLHFAQPR